MATFAERVSAVLQRVGADVKALKIADGDLSALTTDNKTNLVAAINEIATAASAPSGAVIDDAATNGDTDVVWSADKVFDTIEAAKLSVKDDLVGGAGAALDTLKELADALENNPSFAADIATALAKRVRVDAAQVFTVLEKKQGCENLGIGDPDTDFVAVYNAAKA